jgi:hypothetical protein
MKALFGSRSIGIPLGWGLSQGAGTLLVASNAWFLSGLSSSPLINTLLPVFGTLPILFSFRRDVRAYGLEILSACILIICAFFQASGAVSDEGLVIAVLLGALIFGLGSELSQLPIQRQLMGFSGHSIKHFRLASEAGALLGFLLTALTFPASRQFPIALLLLLPLLIWSPRRRTEPSDVNNNPPPHDWICALQGALFGALFGLLPLWVRVVDGGKCFDFAMVLLAFGLGRTACTFAPAIHSAWRYILMGVCLAFAVLAPGWLALIPFFPLGVLAAGSDSALVSLLAERGDPSLCWQILLRSSALGGLIGALGIGVITQILSLSIAIPCLIVGFAVMAWIIGRVSGDSSNPRPA